MIQTTNQIKKETLWWAPPFLPFIQLIWCWSEIHFCKYSQAINWTMNILSSKAHIPAGVFSSLSNISEGKTFMNEIKERPYSAGTALFPYDWRSNDSVSARSWLLSCLQRKRGAPIPCYLCWEHSGVSCAVLSTSLFNHCSGLIERYWDKYLQVVLRLALLVLVFLKI